MEDRSYVSVNELLQDVAHSAETVVKQLPFEEELSLEARFAPVDEGIAVTPTPASEKIESFAAAFNDILRFKMNSIAGVGVTELCHSRAWVLIPELEDIAKQVKNYMLRHRAVLSQEKFVKTANWQIRDSF